MDLRKTKIVATIGIDNYKGTDTGTIKQAYSGYNYLLDTKPRILLGHNVGPNAYDSTMDTATVQKLLGVKGELLRPAR